MPADFTPIIDANAAELRRLHERIYEALRSRGRSAQDRETWVRAAAEFHAKYDLLAFPGGYSGALDRILAGDPKTIAAALSFVERRPFFFRSGYMFKALLRKLKRAPMEPTQAKRLEAVLEGYHAYRRSRGKRSM